eukprot:scaffold602_cov298-Pinguiococcus_pyrenoidosus.AAC.49
MLWFAAFDRRPSPRCTRWRLAETCRPLRRRSAPARPAQGAPALRCHSWCPRPSTCGAERWRTRGRALLKTLTISCALRTSWVSLGEELRSSTAKADSRQRSAVSDRMPLVASTCDALRRRYTRSFKLLKACCWTCDVSWVWVMLLAFSSNLSTPAFKRFSNTSASASATSRDRSRKAAASWYSCSAWLCSCWRCWPSSLAATRAATASVWKALAVSLGVASAVARAPSTDSKASSVRMPTKTDEVALALAPRLSLTRATQALRQQHLRQQVGAVVGRVQREGVREVRVAQGQVLGIVHPALREQRKALQHHVPGRFDLELPTMRRRVHGHAELHEASRGGRVVLHVHERRIQAKAVLSPSHEAVRRQHEVEGPVSRRGFQRQRRQ